MLRNTARRRPALLLAASFLGGIAFGDSPSPGALGAALLALAPLILVAAPARRTTVLALLLVGMCGVWAVHDADVAARVRVSGWIPSDGTPRNLEIRGRVLSAPEPTPEGDRRLWIASESGGPSGSEPRRAVLLVRVRRSSPEPTSRLDALRRGDRVRLWCRLRLPRRPGNPGQPDGRRALLARGIDATATVKSAHMVEILAVGEPSPLRLLDSVKVTARRRLDLALGERSDARAVLGAMLLGDRAGLDPERQRLLRDAGLVHLISISGLHVGLVLMALSALLRRTRLRRLGTLLGTVCALGALVFFVGPRPPVARASLSGVLLAAGRFTGRDGEPLNTLACVAVFLVALRPHLLWDAGFQLSFLASFGILATTPSVAAALPLPRPLSLAAAVSASAYLFTAPAVAWHFGRVAPCSLLSNLLSAPLCGVALVSGAAAALTEGVPALGGASARAATASVETLLAIARVAGEFPGGALRVAAPTAWLVGGYFTLLLAASSVGRHRIRDRAASLAAGRLARLGFAVVASVLHLGPFPPGPGDIEVRVIDVGQAQSVVVRGPSGGFLVVDCGGTGRGRFDAGERLVAPLLASSGCRRIETIVLTHGHDDHAGGAIALLREFEVGEVWISPLGHREAALREISAAAAARRVPVVVAGRGFRARRAGASLEVLHPASSDAALGVNDRSVVLRVSVPGASLLIPGDLEGAGERSVGATGRDLSADALVVGHHGSPGSTGPSFLDAVHPEVAVISVGFLNPFGHPAGEVVERLRAAGVRVYRTDRDGQVILRSGGAGWSAAPWIE